MSLSEPKVSLGEWGEGNAVSGGALPPTSRRFHANLPP
jgi:hypothetical protein